MLNKLYKLYIKVNKLNLEDRYTFNFEVVEKGLKIEIGHKNPYNPLFYPLDIVYSKTLKRLDRGTEDYLINIIEKSITQYHRRINKKIQKSLDFWTKFE